MGEDEATDTTLRAYGDAVDMAVKAPTLLGIIVALVGITVIWAWRHFQQRHQARASGRQRLAERPPQ